MNTLELTTNNPIFNKTVINWSDLSVEAFLKKVNKPYRTVELEKGIVLYVIDEEGIRFWVLNNKVRQAQLLIQKDEAALNDPKMPAKEFNGVLVLSNMQLTNPIHIDDLKDREDIKLVKDTDSIQYGLNIYFLYLDEKKYTLWVDKNDEIVSSIYF